MGFAHRIHAALIVGTCFILFNLLLEMSWVGLFLPENCCEPHRASMTMGEAVLDYFGQNFRVAEKVLKAANRSRQADFFSWLHYRCLQKCHSRFRHVDELRNCVVSSTWISINLGQSTTPSTLVLPTERTGCLPKGWQIREKKFLKPCQWWMATTKGWLQVASEKRSRR